MAKQSNEQKSSLQDERIGKKLLVVTVSEAVESQDQHPH